MSEDRAHDRLADLAQIRELAQRLFHFSRMVPASADFCVGWTLGERLASLIEDQGDAADLAWLIEFLGECIAQLAATLREDHLAKSHEQ